MAGAEMATALPVRSMTVMCFFVSLRCAVLANAALLPALPATMNFKFLNF